MNNQIPNNSISCYIGRICETPSDNFVNDGILWVDFYDLAGTKNGPKHGENGTTQHKAYASWTLRSAYIAWLNPPKITFKGNLKVKGKISIPNAQLSNINISGGPPMQGTTTCSSGPGTAVVPVIISNATGTGKIEQFDNAEIDMQTEGENLDIELISQKGAQLPWCITQNSTMGDSIDDEADFITAGDMAICIAFGNSLDNLYVVDIFK